MKKILIIFLTLVMFLPAAYAETTYATFEQIANGECNGETVEVKAIALPIHYYNLRYVWALQKADGSYAQISTSDTRWCVTENEYNSANSTVKNAIDNQEPITLKVFISSSGVATVEKMYVSNYMQEEWFNSETMLPIAVMLGLLAMVFIIAYLYLHSERGKKSQMMAKAKPIKTKFIDSSHTVYTQRSTSSTIGRAVVGGAIGGGLGAIVGASTGKNKNTLIDKTTFMVYYDNGVHQVETVSNGSYQYKRYMELLDVGD